MRNDIINMLKRCKRKKLEITALGDDENGEEECTDRGLEMYFPGQLTKKKKARQQFSIFVLSNYEVFQEICDTTEEIEEELKTYASALSQPGKKEALRLAEQDAFKARKIYEEMLKQYNSNSSSSNNDTRCERSALNQLNSVTFAPAQAIAA